MEHAQMWRAKCSAIAIDQKTQTPLETGAQGWLRRQQMPAHAVLPAAHWCSSQTRARAQESGAAQLVELGEQLQVHDKQHEARCALPLVSFEWPECQHVLVDQEALSEYGVL
jgi:hypothetical protein